MSEEKAGGRDNTVWRRDAKTRKSRGWREEMWYIASSSNRLINFISQTSYSHSSHDKDKTDRNLDKICRETHRNQDTLTTVSASPEKVHSRSPTRHFIFFSVLPCIMLAYIWGHTGDFIFFPVCVGTTELMLYLDREFFPRFSRFQLPTYIRKNEKSLSAIIHAHGWTSFKSASHIFHVSPS